jgi:hypothetical protein
VELLRPILIEPVLENGAAFTVGTAAVISNERIKKARWRSVFME